MAQADMFLKATSQRSGEITGESSDRAFPNQIEILDWSWGMSAPTAVGGARAGRVTLKELVIVKRADKASTALMAVMNNNEIITTATLTVRKAGGSAALPYFVVKLTQARINAYDVRSSLSNEGAPTLVETLSLAFKEISIDYTPQAGTGLGGGASNFTGRTGAE